METERVGERCDRGIEVGDGDDHVVDAGRHGVEARPDAVGCGHLVGRRLGPVTGHLDAMRLGQQHAEQLLGEVGIDTRIDGQLATRRHHVAHPVGLDDRRVRVLLDGGHLLAERQTSGDHANELAVELIDLVAQRGEIARRGHPATLATGTVGSRRRQHALRGVPVEQPTLEQTDHDQSDRAQHDHAEHRGPHGVADAVGRGARPDGAQAPSSAWLLPSTRYATTSASPVL